MADLGYADPTVVKKPLAFDVLPPPQEVTRMANPPAVRQPLDIRQTTGGQLTRPIQYHAQPHTVPSVQEQIRLDGENWKTIDITPNRPRVNTTQSVIAGTNVVSNNNFAQEQAFEQAAYLFGWSLAGLWDGAIEGKNYPNERLRYKRDFAEDGAYTIGNRVGDELRNLSKQAKDNLEDLWKNKPSFEIPQIKIPSIDRPHIPDFKFPDLPEFKIPEFKFTEQQEKDKPQIEKSKPIPRTKIRQLRELELSPCGSISFGITFAFKITGDRFVPTPDGGGYTELIREPFPVEEVYKMYRIWWEQQDIDYGNYKDLREWLDSGGGTGYTQTVNLGNGIAYRRYQGIGNGVYEGGSPYGNGYPRYYASQDNISVDGLRTKSAINSILNALTVNYDNLEVYWLEVSSPNAKDCPINKPIPVNPPELKEYCDCMSCCPEIDYRKIKAFIDDAVSKIEPIASLPLSWQIRNEGSRPQLIIQSAEENGVDKEGKKKYKSAMYPISVPHWDAPPNAQIFLPSYIKGNYEGIFTLSDNSKVTINAKNEIECQRILNAIKPHISKQYLQDAYFKGGDIVRKEPIKESKVKPMYGRYFKDGQKNNKPDWRINFL